MDVLRPLRPFTLACLSSPHLSAALRSVHACLPAAYTMRDRGRYGGRAHCLWLFRLHSRAFRRGRPRWGRSRRYYWYWHLFTVYWRRDYSAQRALTAQLPCSMTRARPTLSSLRLLGTPIYLRRSSLRLPTSRSMSYLHLLYSVYPQRLALRLPRPLIILQFPTRTTYRPSTHPPLYPSTTHASAFSH